MRWRRTDCDSMFLRAAAGLLTDTRSKAAMLGRGEPNMRNPAWRSHGYASPPPRKNASRRRCGSAGYATAHVRQWQFERTAKAPAFRSLKHDTHHPGVFWGFDQWLSVSKNFSIAIRSLSRQGVSKSFQGTRPGSLLRKRLCFIEPRAKANQPFVECRFGTARALSVFFSRRPGRQTVLQHSNDSSATTLRRTCRHSNASIGRFAGGLREAGIAEKTRWFWVTPATNGVLLGSRPTPRRFCEGSKVRLTKVVCESVGSSNGRRKSNSPRG